MGTVNYGTQTISFVFKEPGKSENFNKINYKLIEKGIYEGGLFTYIDATHIEVTPLIAYIEDNTTEVGIRLKTSVNVNLLVDNTSPYIILRYVWINAINNYVDVLATDYASILADDIIVGKCIFTGTTLENTFDYSKTHYSMLKANLLNKLNFKVIPQEPYTNTVSITGGSINNGNEELIVPTTNSPVFSDTVDGRIDLLYMTNEGTFAIEEGVDSLTPITPLYRNRYVIAEISRGALETYVTGADILLINNSVKNIRTNDIIKGKNNITISNYNNDLAPVVKAGSVFENKGNLITVNVDSTPANYSSITVSTTFYLYYDESASAFIFSNTIPAWSDDLQGWYNGNDRAFFSMYKDAGGTLYQLKNLLLSKNNLIADNNLTVNNNLTVENTITSNKRINSYSSADCAIYGSAVNYGVYGYASTCCGVYGCAQYKGVYGYAPTAFGVYGYSFNYGGYGLATHDYGVYGCACNNYGLSGHAGVNYGLYAFASGDYGAFGYAQNYGVYGLGVNAYPVAGNGAYYDASDKFLKIPVENICVSRCLIEKPLKIYKWKWEDSNQRGFDEFIGPYAQNLKETFGLTEEDTGKYTVDGIALQLGIELLKEINFLKKRVKRLEENKNGHKK